MLREFKRSWMATGGERRTAAMWGSADAQNANSTQADCLFMADPGLSHCTIVLQCSGPAQKAARDTTQNAAFHWTVSTNQRSS